MYIFAGRVSLLNLTQTKTVGKFPLSSFFQKPHSHSTGTYTQKETSKKQTVHIFDKERVGETISTQLD